MLSDLTAIPRIMRSLKWNNGARLLEDWFSRPRAVAPSYSAPDITTIRMDAWALTFARARQAYEQLIRERIWSNQAGRAQVALMLRRKGLLAGGKVGFGRLTDIVTVQDPDYVNQRTAGGMTTFDDLTAALGQFVFRVVIAGTVAPEPTGGGQNPGAAGYRVRVSEIGAYIRDSFDFEGNQPLGCWSDGQPMMFSPVLLPGTAGGMVFVPELMLTPVGNETSESGARGPARAVTSWCFPM